MSAVEQWRGVAAEDAEELSGRVSALLQRRSRRLLGSLLAPHRGRIWLLVLAVLVQNAALMAGPWLVGLGIDRGIPAVGQGHPLTLYVIVGAIVVAAAVQAVAYRLFVMGAGRVGQDLLLDLRERVFGHFQRLSLAFHERYTSGRVISRLTSDLDAITELLEAGFDTLVTSALSIVSIGVILVVLDRPLGLVALTALVPLTILSRWFQLESTTAYRRTRAAVALVVTHFTESLAGIRAVHAFRREPRNDEIFARVNEDYRRATYRTFELVTIYWPGIRLIGNVTTAAVLLYGGLRAVNGSLQVGVLAAFLLYLRRFFEPMAEISEFYNAFQGAAAALEKLSGVLEEDPSVPMPSAPAPEPRGGWLGEVRFQGVRFGYREGMEVLPHLDLTVPAGQTVAMVGRTGAGKTTIARLLFTGTVAENIAFGRPDATAGEIEDAARAIGAHAFIEALPNGYDTQVEKRGSRLSAGQRQLVAFARAFLADPAVLILDEATSSLDVPSERAVQRALRTVLVDRTALIIAHRLSTVEIADRVLVLEDGRVVEDGRPTELIAAGGEYADLHQAWRESLL
jgi:ABC-type multidrug transport system fused ATPase/permease subunit